MPIWRRRHSSARASRRCCWTARWPKSRSTFRLLGGILHREERAETLARFAEALLLPSDESGLGIRAFSVARGADGLTVVAPGTDLAETFTRLGWQLVAPAGQGPSRQASLDDIRDARSRCDRLLRSCNARHAGPIGRMAVAARRARWARVRRTQPCRSAGWTNRRRSTGCSASPGSAAAIRRTLAALFNAVVYGRVLTARQLDALLAGVHSLQP